MEPLRGVFVCSKLTREEKEMEQQEDMLYVDIIDDGIMWNYEIDIGTLELKCTNEIGEFRNEIYDREFLAEWLLSNIGRENCIFASNNVWPWIMDNIGRYVDMTFEGPNDTYFVELWYNGYRAIIWPVGLVCETLLDLMDVVDAHAENIGDDLLGVVEI
jgi:hypothetical protein